MLTIYTHPITNRIKYTFDLIFDSIIKTEYRIITDVDLFRECDGVKFSYTTKPIGNEVFFQSSKLLFETGINSSLNHYLPKEFETENMDIFAMIFFLVSRYEEYMPFTADQYGRFSAKQSYTYKHNILHLPIVNIWAKKIQKKISDHYPAFTFSTNQYSYMSTIDIDNAYAYLGKNIVRTMGGFVKALLKNDSNDLTKRINVLSGKEKDPYDTYDYQITLHNKYALKPFYFFLLGDWATYDKNLPHTNRKMQTLIKHLSENNKIGIHPSFASNQNPAKLKLEKSRLEEISDCSISKSRQHFLMLRFPDTYRNLIAAGIKEDYTMGYADEIGFRAGICTPFKFYDLLNEKETELTIHPFAIMDGTLNSYLKLSPDIAIKKVKEIIEGIKKVNGEFISIWHNETLSEWREWKGWRIVYEEMLREACSDISSLAEIQTTSI